jgi:hypothetical protein
VAADNATTLRRATRREWRTRSSRNPGIRVHRVKASWADGSWYGWGCGRAGLRPGLPIWTRTGIWGRPWIHLRKQTFRRKLVIKSACRAQSGRFCSGFQQEACPIANSLPELVNHSAVRRVFPHLRLSALGVELLSNSLAKGGASCKNGTNLGPAYVFGSIARLADIFFFSLAAP